MGDIVLGSKVSFSWEEKIADDVVVHKGTGEVIGNADASGRVFVAVDPEPPEARHIVILCATTWLTPVA